MMALALHPWASDSGSRHPVEAGAESQGRETPTQGAEAVSDVTVLHLYMFLYPYKRSMVWWAVPICPHSSGL